MNQEEYEKAIIKDVDKLLHIMKNIEDPEILCCAYQTLIQKILKGLRFIENFEDIIVNRIVKEKECLQYILQLTEVYVHYHKEYLPKDIYDRIDYLYPIVRALLNKYCGQDSNNVACLNHCLKIVLGNFKYKHFLVFLIKFISEFGLKNFQIYTALSWIRELKDIEDEVIPFITPVTPLHVLSRACRNILVSSNSHGCPCLERDKVQELRKLAERFFSVFWVKNQAEMKMVIETLPENMKKEVTLIVRKLGAPEFEKKSGKEEEPVKVKPEDIPGFVTRANVVLQNKFGNVLFENVSVFLTPPDSKKNEDNKPTQNYQGTPVVTSTGQCKNKEPTEKQQEFDRNLLNVDDHECINATEERQEDPNLPISNDQCIGDHATVDQQEDINIATKDNRYKGKHIVAEQEVDPTLSETSGFSVEQEVESETSSFPVKRKVESETSGFQVEQEVESETSSFPVKREVESETSGFLVEQEVESETSSFPVEREVESETSSFPVEREVESETSGFLVEQEVESETSSFPVEQEVESETSGFPVEQEVESETSVFLVEQEVESETSVFLVEQEVESKTSGFPVDHEVDYTTSETSAFPVDHEVDYTTSETSGLPQGENLENNLDTESKSRKKIAGENDEESGEESLEILFSNLKFDSSQNEDSIKDEEGMKNASGAKSHKLNSMKSFFSIFKRSKSVSTQTSALKISPPKTEVHSENSINVEQHQANREKANNEKSSDSKKYYKAWKLLQAELEFLNHDIYVRELELERNKIEIEQLRNKIKFNNTLIHNIQKINAERGETKLIRASTPNLSEDILPVNIFSTPQSVNQNLDKVEETDVDNIVHETDDELTEQQESELGITPSAWAGLKSKFDKEEWKYIKAEMIMKAELEILNHEINIRESKLNAAKLEIDELRSKIKFNNALLNNTRIKIMRL